MGGLRGKRNACWMECAECYMVGSLLIVLVQCSLFDAAHCIRCAYWLVNARTQNLPDKKSHSGSICGSKIDLSVLLPPTSPLLFPVPCSLSPAPLHQAWFGCRRWLGQLCRTHGSLQRHCAHDGDEHRDGGRAQAGPGIHGDHRCSGPHPTLAAAQGGCTTRRSRCVQNNVSCSTWH